MILLGLSDTMVTSLYLSNDESRLLEAFSGDVYELLIDVGQWAGLGTILVVPFSASSCLSFDSFSGEKPTIGDNAHAFAEKD